jgi:hypothetical protein
VFLQKEIHKKILLKLFYMNQGKINWGFDETIPGR